MSRSLGLTLLLALLVLVPLSHFVISGPPASAPPGKVQICHFSSGDTVGHVIEVSAAALSAHLDKHGDCKHFITDTSGEKCKCVPCLTACDLEYKQCYVDCKQTKDPVRCIAACKAEHRACQAKCKRLPPGPKTAD